MKTAWNGRRYLVWSGLLVGLLTGAVWADEVATDAAVERIFEQIEAAVLAMDDLEAKLIAARTLREQGFAGPIVSHALFEDHVERIEQAGADQTYLTMQEAGRSLASHAVTAMTPKDGET